MCSTTINIYVNCCCSGVCCPTTTVAPTTTPVPTTTLPPEPPAPPPNLSSISDGGTYVMFTWDESLYADSYTLFRSLDSAPYDPIVTYTSHDAGFTTRNYLDFDAYFSGTWAYRVVATNTYGLTTGTFMDIIK